MGLARLFLDLHADAADVDIHDLVVPEIPVAPDVIQDAGTVQRRVLIVQEILHDLVLHLCQVDELAVLGDGAALEIEGKGSALNDAGLLVLDEAHADPPVDGIHTGGQLRGREGLGDVVVRPEHQTADLIHFLCACGKHDDAQRGALLPQLLADSEAVDAGHHDVQQHDVEVAVLLVKDTERLLTAVHIDHLVACTFQIDHDKITNDIFVLANQNPFHGMPAPF